MRMWGVNPTYLCRKHLLGEHVEMHMFVGFINKGKRINGFIGKGLVEPFKIRTRHLELAAEIRARGYKHKSPLPIFSFVGAMGKVDIKRSIKELKHRCSECRARIKERE